jgi:hypothetical protein
MAPADDFESQFRAALVGREVGDTRILGVHAREEEDSDGRPAVFVDLLLTNPPRGRETWPVDDIWTLREIVREAISGLAVEDPWFIRFAPEEAGELEPEDTKEQIPV